MHFCNFLIPSPGERVKRSLNIQGTRLAVFFFFCGSLKNKTSVTERLLYSCINGSRFEWLPCDQPLHNCATFWNKWEKSNKVRERFKRWIVLRIPLFICLFVNFYDRSLCCSRALRNFHKTLSRKKKKYPKEWNKKTPPASLINWKELLSLSADYRQK